MKKSSKTTRVTAEQVSSQWVWLPELVEHIAAASSITIGEARELLLTNAVYRVRPILLERSGVHHIYRDLDGQESVEDLIKVHIGESSSHHTETTNVAAHYSNVALWLSALIKWLEIRKLGFSVSEWNEWMRTTYRLLKDRDLLHGDLGVESERIPVVSLSGGTVPFEELKLMSGYSSPADIKAWLSSSEIQFKTGIRGRPFTTLTAINKALGVEASEETVPERRVISL